MLRIDWVNTTVVRMSGRLAEGCRSEVEQFIGTHPAAGETIVDLSEVTYVDREGEETLRWLAERGAHFQASTPYVHHVCERLKLNAAEPPTIQVHAGKAMRLLLLTALSVACSSMRGQQALNLDMAAVANLAKAQSWAAKQAHENATAAAAVAKQAESLRWGRVNLESQYLRFNAPIDIESPVPASLAPLLGRSALTTPVAPQDNLHVQLQGGVPLFTGGKITNAIREAQAGQKAAAFAAGDADDDAVLQAERNYLAVLLTSEVVKLNQAALGSYKEHLAHAESAFRQGTAAKYDVIRAEAAVADQNRRLVDAANQNALAEAALRTSLALEDSANVTVGGRLFEIEDVVDLNRAMTAAVQSSAILKALEQKVAASRSAVRVEQGDYLPQVTAIADKELVRNKLAQTDPAWFAGAHVSLPLFEGGERRARVSAARAKLQAAESEYRDAQDQVRLAVHNAYLSLSSAKEQLAAAEKTEQLARESLRLATRRFEVGTGTSLEVLDANVSLTAAQTGIEQALYEMDLAYLSMHRYQGDIAAVSARIQK